MEDKPTAYPLTDEKAFSQNTESPAEPLPVVKLFNTCASFLGVLDKTRVQQSLSGAWKGESTQAHS